MATSTASHPGVRSSARGRLARPRARTVAITIIATALLGFAGFTGYAVVIGSDDLLHPAKSLDCRTPSTAYGWQYEAINYDDASDADLRAVPPTETEPNWTCDGTPAPAKTEVVTSDGIRLAGWYIPAPSGDPEGPTVLLVHGRGSNKSDYLRYAVPLRDAYNIVIFDQRGAGQSSDAANTLGVLEQRDITAQLDWLVATKTPQWVGLVGTSMGASTALAVAVGDPRVGALVLDSMHARVATGIARGIERDTLFPAFPSQPASFFGAWLRTGVNLSSADPVDLIGRLRDRPILLLHGSTDAYDVPAESLQVNLDAATATGVDIEVHVCEGAGHDELIDTCPAAWATWVLDFLNEARSAG